MAKRINENVRFYTEQDPYYYEVDNLPLYDLLNNDKAIQEQIDDIIKGTDSNPVTRRNIDELRPYLGRAKVGSTEYQAIFVRPGKFTARVNTPAETKTGNYEIIPTASGNVEGSVNAVDQLSQQTKSQSVSGVGRLQTVEFRQRVDNTDQYAILEPFDPRDWGDSNPGSIARIDVVYLRAYPAVDQNGNSLASAPDIGVLKGAGIIRGSTTKGNQKSRLTNALGTKAHMLADSTDDSGYGFTLSSGTVVSEGSIPIPEDLLNSFESRIIQAEGGESYNAFYLPLAYVVVPSTYRATTDTIDTQNICDIRPIFRTAELTFNERQAIMFATSRPSIENPFATELSVKQRIDSIQFPEPPKGDPGPPGNPADLGVTLLGMGVIRGGQQYGPEFYFPEANSWYVGTSWDGKPDWDIIDQGIRNDSGNMKVGTASYNAGDYTWSFQNMLCSKKSVSVTLPKEFAYYYVDAEYLYSVPIADTDYIQLDWRRDPRGTYNFVQPGLTVHINPASFTIVTKSFSYYGQGGGNRSNGNLMGAYTLILDDKGVPTWYDESAQSYSTGVKKDPRFDKTRTYAGTSTSEGLVHILPTVIYKVYAVKTNYLTTGGTLKPII